MRKSALDKADQNGEVKETMLSDPTCNPANEDNDDLCLKDGTSTLRRVTRSSGKKPKKSNYNNNASIHQSDSIRQSDESSLGEVDGGEGSDGHQTK